MTELEQMRAMLDRIGAKYEEGPVDDGERYHRDSAEAQAAWERRYGRAWEDRFDGYWTERTEEAMRGWTVQTHLRPGWVSLHLEVGYIDTGMVFDPDGNLDHLFQNE